MPTDSLRNRRKKRTCFAKVSEVEKQLWERIHSHGVLDTGVKGLYCKACCLYEMLFLSDNELLELQNIEYLLWRLHYKHIDEFRKTLCQSEPNMEGFRLFLSEATKFYQDLITSIKRYNGLFDEPWFYKNDGVSGHIDHTKLHSCQFVCHRLCICLGDLARYLELYEKVSKHHRNWAVAASYYLEAAKIYPDGGNPQNQLAVLATYIGEEFLALYHCIRSLAVKEPFPDALQNLMLLFERNRSSKIESLTNEVYDFCNPSNWISNYCEERTSGISTSSKTMEVSECDPCAASDFWSLFIRMTSFFFVDSSLESFACTFTSTLREFEALLVLDVGALSSALQSYQKLNLLKAGPYRALHVISVLLFIIYNLTVDLEQKIPKPTKDGQQSEWINLALTVSFTFTGRLVDRCLKGRPVIYFPLLPALLVFVEWLASANIKLDANDEKCEKAMCYFYGSFVKLLNHLQENTARIKSSCNVALWEDYELRGFVPLSPTHELLDFSTHWEDEINYKMKNEYRARRIVQAAIKIAGKYSDNTHIWLFYDRVSGNFRIGSGEQNSVEEEEDIVFKPIVRHNSEPVTLKDEEIPESSDECLRRASSLLVSQNRALIDSFTSPSYTMWSTASKQPAQNECIPKSPKSSIIAAGPPSLSSWVLSGDVTKNSGSERTVLKSIPEITPDEPSASILTPSAVRVTDNVPSFTGSRQLGFGLLDHWSHNDPLATLPTMYREGSPPLFYPSPSLLHGLHEQRKDFHQQPRRYVSPVVSDVIRDPRLLLEHLKQREWQLQQEPQFTGSYTQK